MSTSQSIRYDVLVAKQYVDKNNANKVQWTQVGVAFPHQSGKGFNIKLDALPLNGELVLMQHEDK